MANFKAQIRASYRDLTGLVLDLRSEDLLSDEGTHDGSSGAAALTDSTANWTTNAHVGRVVQNVTDGSYGVVTANTATTLTATLVGGSGNVWDAGDAYAIQGDTDGVLRLTNAAPAGRVGGKAAYSGSHDGSNNSATLEDSTAPWEGMDLVGMAVENVTDGSTGWITANDEDSITATLAGGTDNDWDAGDEYNIYDPRFGDVLQDTAANQPVIRTVGGYKVIEFTRARAHTLKVPLDDPFPASWWTVAIELTKGAVSTDDQCAFYAPYLQYWRRISGNQTIQHHSSSAISGGGDHADGAGLLQGVPSDNAELWFEGSSVLGGIAGDGEAVPIAAGSAAAYIGSAGGSDYLDGQIRSVRVWDRPLSDLEIDFAFQSLDTDGDDHSVEDRATVALRVWTDKTDDYARINERQKQPQRFVVATVDGKARVQIAAAVDGKVRRDAELNSSLFQLSVIEVPGAVPMVVQDSGWSAVFDVELDENYPGHYCYLLSRENGGGVIVHFDVEAAP